ncbi:hypothetical protein BESB_080720 [Besnoitia besnoiti]|uniref:Phospho-2-dehydro-3-deoxyheptonate aldolase,related protein n=1 Tax=Besnoitia besnoiti TaxID=94643 RepID=A0A2A9MD29_BESBE|nr:hypothetical protein BESB_080720 [Besnoitia besnoiti]PFH33856.1 hypothetical protein BESB_080720 [Besnoitia besnoiti]
MVDSSPQTRSSGRSPDLPVSGASMQTGFTTQPATASPAARGNSLHSEGPAGAQGGARQVARVNAAIAVDQTMANGDDSEAVLSAMTALFESLNEVHLEGGGESWKPSIKTGDGFKACKQFLCALSAAADALQIRPQSREYRHQFTKNYRALFPDQRRHYRVDVLEASQEGYTMIYVNGERFDFHSSVIESGVNFKLAWINTLEKLHQLQRQDLSTYQYWRSELVPVLVDLDCKWADFEQEYILELIQIERKARRYVMDVISLENQLIYLDSSVATLVAKGDTTVQTAHVHIWQQWQSCRRDYVKKMFRLNSIANYRRKGRGDLDLSVLETAENIIKTSESHPGHVYECVAGIASSCVTSFNDFRKHIMELAQTPERIDPHLCNNVTLVNHLVRVEETWELAQKYLMDAQRLRNVIHIVDFIVAIVKTQKAILMILNTSSTGSSPAAAEASKSLCHDTSKAGGSTPLRSSPGSAIDAELPGEDASQARASAPNYPECPANARLASFEPKAETTQDSLLGGAPTSSSSIRATPTVSRHRTTSSHGAERRETLEEKLLACDVEAFLALPRFVCLYYLLDPIYRSQVLQQFLPHYFVESPSTADPPSELADECWGQKPSAAGCVASLGKLSPSLSASQSLPQNCGNASLLPGSEASSSASSASSQSSFSFSASPSGHSQPANVENALHRGAHTSTNDSNSAMDAQGLDMSQQMEAGAGEDCRLLSAYSGDATTTSAPSRFTSQPGEESASSAFSSSSSSSFPAASPPSSFEWNAGAVKTSAASSSDGAGAAHVSRMETDSDVSTMCGSTLRDSVNSFSALQQSAPEPSMGSGGADLSTVRGQATDEAAEPCGLSSSVHPPTADLQRKTQRATPPHSDACSRGLLSTSLGSAGRQEAGGQIGHSQHANGRYILSKVPPGLRKMVKAWLVLQAWLRAEGLEDCREAWLCVIARLADSDDFRLLLQKWAGTKLVGFRHQLEALFQAVEEISMALQRSSPQDWNEFLQAIIQGIERDSPRRRSVC